MADEYVTAEELAAELKVPVARLYEWRYRGVGPRAFKVGVQLRFGATRR